MRSASRRIPGGAHPVKIHVVIVSDQTLPNLIPILMMRPDKVYLACSHAMKSRGLDRQIKRLLEQEAIGAETKSGAPNAGLKSIHDYARWLAAQIQQAHPGAEIVLNATGGTKLMSLGFVEVFRDIAREIIYTDTSHRRIEIFPDGSGTALPPVEMRNVLVDVPRYLAAQGFRYVGARSDDPAWREQVASRKAISTYLGKHAEAIQVQDFIGAINGLANSALGKQVNEAVLREPRQSFRTIPRGKWARALAQMARARLVDWRDGGCQIHFIDAESALFLRGGWLEEYAWHVVQGEGAWDARCNVEVTAANELLVMECKTLRYQEENDNQIAYKIDSLGQQMRGLFGETWLLSAREPTDTLLERARRARIRIVAPAELPGLPSAVRDWMNRPNEGEPLLDNTLLND
ncbi:MAG: DUF1887 domain-containing protein [Acidobacteria bacterium]|nr:MAG: DUF1887 domain-containing protein [Acidobacteriota bacterium]